MGIRRDGSALNNQTMIVSEDGIDEKWHEVSELNRSLQTNQEN